MVIQWFGLIDDLKVPWLGTLSRLYFSQHLTPREILILKAPEPGGGATVKPYQK
jgi:hypothetical protein